MTTSDSSSDISTKSSLRWPNEQRVSIDDTPLVVLCAALGITRPVELWKRGYDTICSGPPPAESVHHAVYKHLAKIFGWPGNQSDVGTEPERSVEQRRDLGLLVAEVLSSRESSQPERFGRAGRS